MRKGKESPLKTQQVVLCLTKLKFFLKDQKPS